MAKNNCNGQIFSLDERTTLFPVVHNGNIQLAIPDSTLKQILETLDTSKLTQDVEKMVQTYGITHEKFQTMAAEVIAYLQHPTQERDADWQQNAQSVEVLIDTFRDPPSPYKKAEQLPLPIPPVLIAMNRYFLSPRFHHLQYEFRAALSKPQDMLHISTILSQLYGLVFRKPSECYESFVKEMRVLLAQYEMKPKNQAVQASLGVQELGVLKAELEKIPQDMMAIVAEMVMPRDLALLASKRGNESPLQDLKSLLDMYEMTEIPCNLPKVEQEALLYGVQNNTLSDMEIRAAEQYIPAHRESGAPTDVLLAEDVGRALIVLRANIPRCLDELLEWLDCYFNSSGESLPETPIFSFSPPIPQDLL